VNGAETVTNAGETTGCHPPGRGFESRRVLQFVDP